MTATVAVLALAGAGLLDWRAVAARSGDPLGAGGPLAGIGGAGAFIPPAHVNGPFGAGGALAGIGGAGAFIPPSGWLAASGAIATSVAGAHDHPGDFSVALGPLAVVAGQRAQDHPGDFSVALGALALLAAQRAQNQPGDVRV